MGAKGIIALDLDGTVTDATHHMPPATESYLYQLHQQGWLILFVTGRTFAYGHQTLKSCRFPYYFSMYNGALLYSMPDQTLITSHEAPASLIPLLTRDGIDPLIHDRDTCYYRPSQHDPDTLAYLHTRRDATDESWTPVTDFSPLEKFSYAKLFATQAELQAVVNSLVDQPLATSLISDPLRPGYSILLVTDQHATKGDALAALQSLHPSLPTIGAGDDLNDLSLLDQADYAIAMAGSPPELLAAADLVATSGLPAALRQVISQLPQP